MTVLPANLTDHLSLPASAEPSMTSSIAESYVSTQRKQHNMADHRLPKPDLAGFLRALLLLLAFCLYIDSPLLSSAPALRATPMA